MITIAECDVDSTAPPLFDGPTVRRSLFICDACKKHIYDARLGVALGFPGMPTVHAHKGPCHDEMERTHKTKCSGWMELTAHIAQLVKNSTVADCQHGS